MSEHAYYQPPEWAPHRSCWTAYPYRADLWEDNLVAAQQEFLAFCHRLAADEVVNVLVPSTSIATVVQKALPHKQVIVHEIAYGDIWLRDTGPIFVRDPAGQVVAAQFLFNGWGNKYLYEEDLSVAENIAATATPPRRHFPWILEGGSVDTDGQGTCLTSRQCLLNPNRNPNMGQADIEAALRQALGVSKILWVTEGLKNDHTDGHIDTVARFVAPGVVVCMEPSGDDDPNHDVLTRIIDELLGMVDAQGRALQVVRIPSPGRVMDHGAVLPASYLNFYIGNHTVIVPTYGRPYDAAAVAAIGKLFASRQTCGLSARAILSGGGAFHCITQQEPQ